MQKAKQKNRSTKRVPEQTPALKKTHENVLLPCAGKKTNQNTVNQTYSKQTKIIRKSKIAKPLPRSKNVNSIRGGIPCCGPVLSMDAVICCDAWLLGFRPPCLQILMVFWGYLVLSYDIICSIICYPQNVTSVGGGAQKIRPVQLRGCVTCAHVNFVCPNVIKRHYIIYHSISFLFHTQ